MVAQLRTSGWTWTSAGAVSALSAGIILPILGSLLTAIAWFTGPEWHGLAVRRDGTLLLFLGIPLLALGAHCLDLLDRRIDKERRRRIGPVDNDPFARTEGTEKGEM